MVKSLNALVGLTLLVVILVIGCDFLGMSDTLKLVVQIDETKLVEDLKAQNYVKARLDPATATAEEDAAIEAKAKSDAQATMADADDLTCEVLRMRLENIGIKRTVIEKTQGNRILISAPVADTMQATHAEQTIARAGTLAFRLVHKDNDFKVREVIDGTRTPDGFERSTCDGRVCFVRSADYSKLAEAPNFAVKLGRFAAPSAFYECVMEEIGNDPAGRKAYLPMFVSRSREATVGGETVVKAVPSKKPATGQVVVDIEFDGVGTQAFARLTGRYVGRQLAIVLDDIVRFAPVLRSEISDGRCEISGSFTWKEATELAGVLNAGALKAPIRIIETRYISSSEEESPTFLMRIKALLRSI